QVPGELHVGAGRLDAERQGARRLQELHPEGRLHDLRRFSRGVARGLRLDAPARARREGTAERALDSAHRQRADLRLLFQDRHQGRHLRADALTNLRRAAGRARSPPPDSLLATTIPAPALGSSDDIALADRLKTGHDQIIAELRKLIVGQEDVIELVLLSLFTGGNSLIVGVPGLAKTLLINTVAQVLDLKFSRIQFTPDLMPSDITGTDIIQDDPQSGQRRLVFTPGPIFANIVLADEINRTPPKTQSALLEAMQEHRVTVQGKTYRLEEPF